jgi:type II secretory pathway component PulC
VGDTLKPGYTVTKITNYYILVSQGVTELLWKKSEEKPPAAELAGGGRERPGPRPGPEEKKPEEKKPEEKKDQTPYAQGVKQTGPYEYQIDRAMLNEQLGDLAKLGREARVIPNYDRDSGTYKGFKLIGVRPNSLYRAIGIRSGDVIMQINGEELSSPSKALELFTKLQNSNEITLDIMRGGKKQTLQYKIE